MLTISMAIFNSYVRESLPEGTQQAQNHDPQKPPKTESQ